MLTVEVCVRLPIVYCVAYENAFDKGQVENAYDSVETHVGRVDGLEENFVGVETRVEVGRDTGLFEKTVPRED